MESRDKRFAFTVNFSAMVLFSCVASCCLSVQSAKFFSISRAYFIHAASRLSLLLAGIYMINRMIGDFHYYLVKRGVSVFPFEPGHCFPYLQHAKAVKNILEYQWATLWENLFIPYANNKGADQPAHPRSLINAFVVRCLVSIKSLLATAEIPSL